MESKESKVRAVIRTVLERKPELADGDVATEVTRSEPDLIVEWVMERLQILTRMLRRKLPDPNQMVLPFADLSMPVPVKDGKVELASATIGKLRDWRKQLLDKRVASAKKPRSHSVPPVIYRPSTAAYGPR